MQDCLVLVTLKVGESHSFAWSPDVLCLRQWVIEIHQRQQWSIGSRKWTGMCLSPTKPIIGFIPQHHAFPPQNTQPICPSDGFELSSYQQVICLSWNVNSEVAGLLLIQNRVIGGTTHKQIGIQFQQRSRVPIMSKVVPKPL